LENRVKKSESKLSNVKSNKEYTAALKEIDDLKKGKFSLEDNVLLMYGDKQHIATIKGVDDQFVKVSGIDSMVYDGAMQLQDRNRSYAVVGQGVAYSLRIGLNFVDPLFVYTIDRKARINMAQPEESIRRDFIYPSVFWYPHLYQIIYRLCLFYCERCRI